ncbi:MAG: hypothetical protein WBB23_01440 [Desulforhopalus sp.]
MNVKQILTVMISGCLLLAASLCMAANGEQSVRPVLDKLLNAVESNDYAGFVADGTEAFKAEVTEQVFEDVSTRIAPRMKDGYKALYLGELEQQDYLIHLWRLEYKDGGDDTMAKLVTDNGKVAGFWLQ